MAYVRTVSSLFALTFLFTPAGCNSPGQTGDCATSRDCAMGEACVSGVCTPVNSAAGCMTDQNCGPGEICDPVTFTCMTPQVTNCSQDDECPASQRCNTLTGVCIDGRRSCTAEGECSSGLHCDVPAQQCVECLDGSHCGPNETCTAGSCVPDSMPPPQGGCSTDSQCNPPSQICMAGECTLGCAQPGGITCSNGEVCDNTTGRCISIRGPCTSDSECSPPAEVCESGQCIPGCTEVGGVQCPGGQQCNPSTGRCTQVGDICLSDLDCNQPQEICNLTSGACDPGCASTGCSGGDTCDQATGHCVGTQTCSPDRLEPNDAPGQASTGGGTQVGLTLCPGDVDFFAVSLGAGDDITVTIDFVQGEGNIDAELLDAGGSPVASANGTGNQETIQYTSTAGGDYTIRVFLTQDLGPTPGNQYSIDVDATAAPCAQDSFEDNDSPLLPPTITAGTHQLNVCDGDDDYFDVYLQTGEEITVNAYFSQAEGDVDLALLGFLGVPLDTSVSTTDNESVTYVADSDDFVTIQVTLYQDAGATPGNPYDLEIIVNTPQPQTCTVDSFEENDTQGTAAPLASGSHGNLNTCETDEDFYAITLQANEDLTVDATFSNAEGDIDLELLDSSGTVVTDSASASDDESITYTAPASGTYFLRVFLYSDAGSTLGNDYGLDVSISGAPPNQCIADSFEPNDDIVAAPVITMGSYQNLGSCGDDDYYRVDLTAGDTITIDALFSHAEGDIDLALLDTQGNVALTSETTSDDETIAAVINVTGTFTILVYLYQDNGSVPGNDYTLMLSP